MKPTYLFTAAASLFLLAAPLSLAQVTPAPTTPAPAVQTDPAAQPNASTSMPSTPTTELTTPAAPSNPATPAAPANTPAQTAANTPEGQPSCRTRKDVGEQCSCLSAPTDFGTSAAAENGSHNMCVVPN